MFCGRCGHPLNGNIICPNCSYNNINNEQFQNNDKYVLKQKYDKTVQNQIIIGVCISCSIIVIVFVYLMLTSNSKSVYFSNEENVNDTKENVEIADNSSSKKIGVTSINYDNIYYINIPTTEEVVLNQVREDSLKQKENCSQDIIDIENRIIANYQIEAVNLCELNTDFALEVEKAIKYIYDEYPTARGYLTHISLGNVPESGTIAFFQWYAPITLSYVDGLTGYRSRIILNSNYYLNESKFESSVEYSTAMGHFPKNATKYSALIHEFGHYLSFIATNNYYSSKPQIIYSQSNSTSPYFLAILDFAEGSHSKRMIEEAYQNYKAKTNTSYSFDEFRATISGYAMATDENGEYIYDEPVAEAFHDVYLNGNNAADASKEIVSVLEKYLEM